MICNQNVSVLTKCNVRKLFAATQDELIRQSLDRYLPDGSKQQLPAQPKLSASVLGPAVRFGIVERT